MKFLRNFEKIGGIDAIFAIFEWWFWAKFHRFLTFFSSTCRRCKTHTCASYEFPPSWLLRVCHLKKMKNIFQNLSKITDKSTKCSTILFAKSFCRRKKSILNLVFKPPSFPPASLPPATLVAEKVPTSSDILMFLFFYSWSDPRSCCFCSYEIINSILKIFSFWKIRHCVNVMEAFCKI